MKIGNKKFDLKNETVVMGIINASPDSFSGDGLTGVMPETIKIVEKFIKAGVDIIDVGGESTRPKKIYSKVQDISVQQEIDRVLPVIEKIKTSFDIPVSIDTRKSAVASVAIDYGADMINDVSMMKYDSNMIDLIFSSDKPYILTHNYPINKTKSATFQVKDNLINELNRLKKAGINQDKIIGLVIEFHDCDFHFEKIKSFIDQFKLQLVHIHVNNYGDIDASGFATVIELTFSPQSYNAIREKNDNKFPVIRLDQPNNKNRKDEPIIFE